MSMTMMYDVGRSTSDYHDYAYTRVAKANLRLRALDYCTLLQPRLQTVQCSACSATMTMKPWREGMITTMPLPVCHHATDSVLTVSRHYPSWHRPMLTACMPTRLSVAVRSAGIAPGRRREGVDGGTVRQSLA